MGCPPDQITGVPAGPCRTQCPWDVPGTPPSPWGGRKGRFQCPVLSPLRAALLYFVHFCRRCSTRESLKPLTRAILTVPSKVKLLSLKNHIKICDIHPRLLNTNVFQGAVTWMVEFWKDPFKGASAHGTLGQRRVLRRDKLHTSNWDNVPIGNGELGPCKRSSVERGQAGRWAEQVQETRTKPGKRNSRVTFTEGFSSAALSSTEKPSWAQHTGLVLLL